MLDLPTDIGSGICLAIGQLFLTLWCDFKWVNAKQVKQGFVDTSHCRGFGIAGVGNHFDGSPTQPLGIQVNIGAVTTGQHRVAQIETAQINVFVGTDALQHVRIPFGSVLDLCSLGLGGLIIGHGQAAGAEQGQTKTRTQESQ